MLFNSYEFIFAFLPATICVYFMLGRFGQFAQQFALLCASWLFYAWWDVRALRGRTTLLKAARMCFPRENRNRNRRIQPQCSARNCPLPRDLPSDDVLAACRPSLPLGRAGMVDIVSLASHPLLLLDSGYSVRRLFNAACRIAEVEPNILLESRAPHTLLAFAETGQGVAVIPSVLRTDRYKLKIVRVTHRYSATIWMRTASGDQGVKRRPVAAL
jgi:hypothetical protein